MTVNRRKWSLTDNSTKNEQKNDFKTENGKIYHTTPFRWNLHLITHCQSMRQKDCENGERVQIAYLTPKSPLTTHFSILAAGNLQGRVGNKKVVATDHGFGFFFFSFHSSYFFDKKNVPSLTFLFL